MDRERSGGACTRRLENRWQTRKTIRLPPDAYLAGEPFLLTVCATNRQDLLTRDRYGREAYEAMLPAAEKTDSELWCGVVMPDHVHLVVSAQPGKSPLDMAACFKRLTTMSVRDQGYAGVVWQRRIHDRGLRIDFNNDLEAVVRYVLDNPVRRDLVRSWEDWPFSHLHPEVGTRL